AGNRAQGTDWISPVGDVDIDHIVQERPYRQRRLQVCAQKVFRLPDQKPNRGRCADIQPVALQAFPKQVPAKMQSVQGKEWWDSLLFDRLQKRGEQLLFFLVMPGVEPNRVSTARFQLLLQQVHQR